MTNLEERKVVVHNDLITNVVAKMDAVPMKIFELIVSAIDTNNPPKDNIIYLSKNEVYGFFDANDKDRSVRFREHFKNLHKQTIFEEKLSNGKKKNRVISPFRITEWYDDDDQDVIKILIEENFMPYLIELKNNFTQYMISDISNFKRKHTIILYRWLMMKWNQYKRYRSFQLKNPIMKVDELRILTDTKSKYKKWQNFETEVIKKSLHEINQHSHVCVSYDLVRKGRSYTEIQFYIEDREKPTKKTPDYLEEKSDRYEEQYEKHLNERVKKLEILPLALTNNYVAHLIRQDLIDLQDTDKIIEAYEILVPLYIRMEELKQSNVLEPMANFEKHIKYVKDNMIDTTLKYRNMIEYLKVSAEQYIYRLEKNQIQNN